MTSKKSLVYATIFLIGISTMIHSTLGKHRVIYMKSDNSRPVPQSETKELKRPISIDIYYETLCPDSLDFFQDQLVPFLGNLQKSLQVHDYHGNGSNGSSLDSNRRDIVDPNSLLDINFIPYGKAVTLEKSPVYTFLCQHGPLECEGNRLHACTLDEVAKVRANKNASPPTKKEDDVTKIKLLNFFVCTMKFLITPRDRDDATAFLKTNLKSSNLTSFSVAALDHCFTELSNSSHSQQLRVQIESCLQPQSDRGSGQGQGSYLLKKYGDLTHGLSPRLYFVPWITFNGIWTKKTFEESRTDVKKVLCSLVTPDTRQLNDILECNNYLEEAEQSKSSDKMGIESKIGRKVAIGLGDGVRKGHVDSGNIRDERGVSSGESTQNPRKRVNRRPRLNSHGRDRRGFLHANNDMDLGGGGAAWRWRTNMHSNPGMEWRWRRPVASAPATAH